MSICVKDSLPEHPSSPFSVIPAYRLCLASLKYSPNLLPLLPRCHPLYKRVRISRSC